MKRFLINKNFLKNVDKIVKISLIDFFIALKYVSPSYIC